MTTTKWREELVTEYTERIADAEALLSSLGDYSPCFDRIGAARQANDLRLKIQERKQYFREQLTIHK